MNKVDEQPNNVTIVVVLVSLVVGIPTTGSNTSGIRILLAQLTLCGGEQTDGQLALLWESEYRYVTARLADLTVGVNIMGHRLMLKLHRNTSLLVLNTER